MQKDFNSFEFINDLSQELVIKFEKAGNGTTPYTVGVARENAVRSKLRQILPGKVDIGTGFVIDSFGYTSKQTDIVIIEKDICPIFSINGTPETTYYPCESVLAVGEIKSILDTDDIVDAFGKIESVKKCQRYIKDSINWRKYFSTFTTLGAESERYNQQSHPKDQIYGFVLCQSLGLTIPTFLERCKEEIKIREPYLLPDLFVSLNDGLALFINKKNKCFTLDTYNADTFYFVKSPYVCFQFLLARLQEIMSVGRTSSVLPFIRYVIPQDSLQLNGQGISLVDE